MVMLPVVSATGRYGVNISTATASTVWPSANLIFYVPLRIPEDCTVKQVFWINGTAVTGNVNLGLYSPAGARQWQTGSTAQSGTSQIQRVNIADQALAAGLWYIALQADAASGNRFHLVSAVAYLLNSYGCLEEQAGSFALPGTATFAKATTLYLPECGLDLRGSP